MEFRETLLAAQRNQQQKSSGNVYYKARFDPPKKEQKQKDKLSANIQKFLAQKEEEERQKKLEEKRKRDELLAMRDPKAIRKIQKTLKVIKSANKSVIEDAVDRDNTAVTREGPDQPDQDDYGYESQEAAAIYEKMMQKYSKIPDEPKFPIGSHSVKKDLNGTRERVKQALQHEDDPVPHKRKRRKDGDKEPSPPPFIEPERKREEKPKIKKIAPPPMDFNQLLKLAEQKKSEPLEIAAKKAAAEPEPDRLMTKKQKREYEEEMARRQRRQERIEATKNTGVRKVAKEEKISPDKERRQEPSTFGRIPKLGDKNPGNYKNESVKSFDKDKNDRERREKSQRDRENSRIDREKLEREKEKAKLEREKLEREKERLNKEKSDRDREILDLERLQKLKAERERIEKDIERLNRDRERLEKTKLKLESGKSEKLTKPMDRQSNAKQAIEQTARKNIDLKSQNTYRIDKNSNDKRNLPGQSSQGKLVPKLPRELGISHKIDARDKETLVKQKDKALQASSDGSSKLNGHSKFDGGKGMPPKGTDHKKPQPINPKTQTLATKPNISNSFDFDKHVNSLKNGQKLSVKNGVSRPPGDVKRKLHPDDTRKMQKRRAVDSESEYDSEMDDFIDDGDENMDYSSHIKEIFGYDRSKYRDMDDDDDPMMESSFARQQREEYISKKIGIMEDLEDMRMEAMEKKKGGKKRRRISDD